MLQTTDKYSLEIISREPDSKGKPFKKYAMDGLETIGVYENEPFKIRFKNLTSQKVQVKLSVDGTDLLTGELADTSPNSKKMWVVQAYDTLELKAWPEDHNGGAEFLFGNTKDSVAANTHGDLSAKGLIAAAVFEEGAPHTYIPVMWPQPQRQQSYNDYKIEWHSNSVDYNSRDRLRRSLKSRNVDSVGDTFSMSDTRCCVDDICEADCGPAVGAGDHVEQHIGTAAGLRQPVFAQVVQVKYEWWTSLRSKLRAQTQAEPPHRAFPGDRGKLINLGDTPRLETPGGRKSRIRKEAIERGQRRRKRTRMRNCRCRRPEQKYVEYERFA